MSIGVAITAGKLPAPQLAQASQIEVHQRIGHATRYQLQYSVDIADGDLPILLHPQLQAETSLSLSVPTLPRAQHLVTGPIHGHRVRLQHGGAGSQLTVVGADSRIVMDRELRQTQWQGSRDSDVVRQICMRYGYVPDIVETQTRHLAERHTLVQRESDLRLVQRLARRNGFWFWISGDVSGVETAHFRPPPIDSLPQATLSINREESTLSSFQIDWDVERPTSVVSQQLELAHLQVLDGQLVEPPVLPMGSRGLAQIAPSPRSVPLTAAVDDVGALQGRAKALLSEAAWFVQARCEVSLHEIDTLIQAHSVIAISGAGRRYSGRYMVAEVKHQIDAASHKMTLLLWRNGW